MVYRSNRYLGAIDAAKDKKFEEHFIEAHDIKRIIDDGSDIIYGAKGVGKTALNRALTEIHSDRYFSFKTVDLNSISFNQVHKKLTELHHKTDSEIIRLASNIWRNVLIIYGLEAFSSALNDDDSLKKEINSIIQLEGVSISTSNGRILNQIQRVIDYIIDISTSNKKENFLIVDQLEGINAFPFNKDIISVLKKCFMYIKPYKKKVLISLDGFDSIINHTPESRRAIFAGLIDAIYKNSTDSKINEMFCFKAFLPQELTDNLESIVWDADKSYNNTHFLKWNINDLKKFLLPRLKAFSRNKSNNFEEVWLEIMPDKIKNTVHGNNENTFNYIARHTLFRPRQLLMHIQKIIDLWDEEHTAFRIDPFFIPKIVSETNYALSNYLAGQLEFSLPGLTDLLQSNYGSSNITNVYELRKKISKKFNVTSHKEITKIFNDLYNLGIYGFAKEKDMPKHGKIFKFEFSYSSNKSIGYRQIHNIVLDNDFMALSPMLHEYCGCSVNQYGTICPKV